MATFKIVVEIEMDETTPLAAAQTVQEWLRNPNTEWQYYVQGEDQKIHSVDLSEADEDAVLPAVDYIPLIQKP